MRGTLQHALDLGAFSRGERDRIEARFEHLMREDMALGALVSYVGNESATAPSREVSILEHVDLCRAEVSRRLDDGRRASLGQFLTPAHIGRLMVSMLQTSEGSEVTLLDPGAGIGTLFAACVERWCSRGPRPGKITVVAYEIEPVFLEYLNDTVRICEAACRSVGIKFEAILRHEDFISSGAGAVRPNLFSAQPNRFTHAILNPPYRKIQSSGEVRRLLRTCGIETSNLYTAFLWLTSMMLMPGGQMVSITPRSFCNGLYFKPFRKYFVRAMNIQRLHLFHSRQEAFKEDDVLQENLIVCARKGEAQQPKIVVSASHGIDDPIEVRELDKAEVVSPADGDVFIHVVTDELQSRIGRLATRFTASLSSLGLEVSTGRVVAFRAEDFVRSSSAVGTAPLIYPAHFDVGFVRWPTDGIKKADAIEVSPATKDLLLPSGNYVLVKRFSSKEERRRVVAAVYDQGRVKSPFVGFENHINYFHCDNHGLDLEVIKGLAAYLNSTVVDTLFRHFSGHTQVNAVDLRKLPYPNLKELALLGKCIGDEFPNQQELDRIIEKELLGMTTAESGESPVTAKARIKEALAILKELGLPKAQQNERSALTMLALLDLKPSTPWSESSDPLIGITPMMDFFSKNYGKSYAPNTRETVRRQTVHQFLQAGLIVENPDDPSRPTNSPKAVYQIERGALKLLRTYGTSSWSANLRAYLASVKTLAQRYAREREMKRIPIQIGGGRTITLSPGGQNVLVEKIISEFGSRFTPGGKLAYVGDTDEKFAHFDEPLLGSLGIKIEVHGKMPDVIIYYSERNWLVLVEAVTSHGPVNPKRREELKRLFKNSSAGLVFVTAFLTRKAMVEYLNDISWETEVWVAEAPSHLIHFNGERFLGPYIESALPNALA